MKWIVSVLDILIFIWAVLAMLRFLLQKGGLPYNHPLASFLYRSTQWIVGEVRKIIPPMKGWDTAIPMSVFLIFLLYEFLKLIISLFHMNISLNVPSLVVGTLLIVILKVVSTFIYAFWCELIMRYLLQNNSKDIQLLQACDFSVKQVLSPFNARYKPILIAFIICTIWVLVVYPNLMYEVQRYMLS
ncbi:hypothetical protein GKC56_08890 [Neisseriaceae bacterium PsAf]|nr:hypothetical protein [Neisseriaceae bacterium PsAf]